MWLGVSTSRIVCVKILSYLKPAVGFICRNVLLILLATEMDITRDFATASNRSCNRNNLSTSSVSFECASVLVTNVRRLIDKDRTPIGDVAVVKI